MFCWHLAEPEDGTNSLNSEHVFLFSVVACDLDYCTLKFEGWFTTECLIRLTLRCLLVFVEWNASDAWDDIHLRKILLWEQNIFNKIWSSITLSQDRLDAFFVVLSHSCFLVNTPSITPSSPDGLGRSKQQTCEKLENFSINQIKNKIKILCVLKQRAILASIG